MVIVNSFSYSMLLLITNLCMPCTSRDIRYLLKCYVSVASTSCCYPFREMDNVCIHFTNGTVVSSLRVFSLF